MRAVLLASLLGGLLGGARSGSAEPAFRQDFNGSGTAWQLLDSTTPAKIVSQGRVPVGARDDAGSEKLVAAAPAGKSLFVACAMDSLAVLPELQVRLWVRSERPAIQLAARVVLPRTVDAESGNPTTVIVRGEKYNRPGQWQQLVLADIPRKLAAEVRVLRASPGARIDSKEAYLDKVVLVVPGDPQGVELLTDNLEVDGILLPEAGDVRQAAHTSEAPLAEATASPTASPVRVQGGVLLVEDRPFLPRIIEWQGEPLAFLAEHGFNTVQLTTAPDEEQSAEAARHGLWFLAGAPLPEALAREPLGRAGDRVLAWYLDDAAIEVDANYARRWAETVRQRDRVAGRPVVVAPRSDGAESGKSADIVAARHAGMGRLGAEEYQRWLESRPSLARPGTPIWASFATQLGEAAHRQVIALSGVKAPAPMVDAAHLESLLRVASRGSVRGFWFESESQLSESDVPTRARAAAVALWNGRLQRVEPWLAAGNIVGRVTSTGGGWDGVVLQVDRARLVVPMAASSGGSVPKREAADAVGAAAPASSTEAAFLVPGVPETSRAYQLSPAALRMLPAQRVAGGTRVVLPSPGDSFLVITEDPQIVHDLRQQVARDGVRIARLERESIAHRANLVSHSARRMAALGFSSDEADRGIASIGTLVREMDSQLAAGRAAEAFLTAQRADEILVQIADRQRQALGEPAPFESNPLAGSAEHLADYAAFLRSYQMLRGGENLLYAGDFEDLGQMQLFGWRHVQQPQQGVESRVELSTEQPRHGQFCLALHCASSAAAAGKGLGEQPAVWVTSPAMPVEKGQLVEITGWVRVDDEIEGEGLQIVDSLGGAELSLAVRKTSGWQPFHMVRAVPETGELRITFALAGTGSAGADAVMVRLLQQPIARRLPPTGSSQSR